MLSEVPLLDGSSTSQTLLNVFLSPMAPPTTFTVHTSYLKSSTITFSIYFCTSLPTVTFLPCLLNDNMIDKIILSFFFTEISDMFNLILNHVISYYPNVLIKCKPLSSVKCENIVFVYCKLSPEMIDDR